MRQVFQLVNSFKINKDDLLVPNSSFPDILQKIQSNPLLSLHEQFEKLKFYLLPTIHLSPGPTNNQKYINIFFSKTLTIQELATTLNLIQEYQRLAKNVDVSFQIEKVLFHDLGGAIHFLATYSPLDIPKAKSPSFKTPKDPKHRTLMNGEKWTVSNPFFPFQAILTENPHYEFSCAYEWECGFWGGFDNGKCFEFSYNYMLGQITSKYLTIQKEQIRTNSLVFDKLASKHPKLEDVIERIKYRLKLAQGTINLIESGV